MAIVISCLYYAKEYPQCLNQARMSFRRPLLSASAKASKGASKVRAFTDLKAVLTFDQHSSMGLNPGESGDMKTNCAPPLQSDIEWQLDV
jgi:hypothetical protein